VTEVASRVAIFYASERTYLTSYFRQTEVKERRLAGASQGRQRKTGGKFEEDLGDFRVVWLYYHVIEQRLIFIKD